VACGRFFSGRLNYPGISQEEETHLRLSYYSSNLAIAQREAKTPKTGSVTAWLGAFVGQTGCHEFPRSDQAYE
jgi:hypothetical protein